MCETSRARAAAVCWRPPSARGARAAGAQDTQDKRHNAPLPPPAARPLPLSWWSWTAPSLRRCWASAACTGRCSRTGAPRSVRAPRACARAPSLLRARGRTPQARASARGLVLAVQLWRAYSLNPPPAQKCMRRSAPRHGPTTAGCAATGRRSWAAGGGLAAGRAGGGRAQQKAAAGELGAPPCRRARLSPSRRPPRAASCRGCCRATRPRSARGCWTRASASGCWRPAATRPCDLAAVRSRRRPPLPRCKRAGPTEPPPATNSTQPGPGMPPLTAPLMVLLWPARVSAPARAVFKPIGRGAGVRSP